MMLAPVVDLVDEVTSGDWGQERPEVNSEECVVVRATDFDSLAGGDVDSAPHRFLRPSSIAKRQLLSGDLLVEMSGGSESQPTGRLVRVGDKVASMSPPVVFSNFVKRLRLKSSVDSEYFALAWRSLYYRGRTKPYEKRTTGIRNFRLDDFLNTEEMPLPPLDEQQRIARTLSTLQRAVQASGTELRSLLELRRTMIADALARVNDFISLEQLVERPQYGYTASASDKGGVRFLRITDLKEDGVDWAAVPSCDPAPPTGDRYVLYDGDLVVARIGATTGKAWLVRDPPLAVFASYLIRLRARDGCDPRFLAGFFGSEAYWHQIDAAKGGRLKGGVNLGNLNSLQVPQLTHEQQVALGDRLDHVGLSISSVRDARDALGVAFSSALDWCLRDTS